MINDKDNKAYEYAEYLIDSLLARKNSYQIDIVQAIKMNKDSLDSLYTQLVPYIQQIIDNGNECILTKDLLYYLTFIALRLSDYGQKLITCLKTLVDLNDKNTVDLYDFYFGDILFNRRARYTILTDPIENYIERMDGEYKEAFLTFKYHAEMIKRFVSRSYEFDIMDRISTLIFAKCVRENKLNIYKELVKKYYDDPQSTIDYFVLNGFLTNDFKLIKEFDDYIYKDMLESEKNITIIR